MGTLNISGITYSIQWPIEWFKLDESKFIDEEEAKRRYHSGEFYFAILWDENKEIYAIIDYTGNFVSVQIFEDGYFEEEQQKVPNVWLVYRAEPQGNYHHLKFCQYRYYNHHYSFRNGTSCVKVTSEFLGHDKDYKGDYDEACIEPLSISFNDFQVLFDYHANIQHLIDHIHFVELKKRKRK